VLARFGRRRLCNQLIAKLAEAWGFMLFQSDVFHADPRKPSY
jgi:predicted unusual protein kinase regulating ubiquinone biosynthesis (AarF/ABC1/UbiB family)